MIKYSNYFLEVHDQAWLTMQAAAQVALVGQVPAVAEVAEVAEAEVGAEHNAK